jgi:hypothetical protein
MQTVSMNQLKVKIPQDVKFKEMEQNKDKLVEMDWDAIFRISIPELKFKEIKDLKEEFLEMDWDFISDKESTYMPVYKHQDCDYEYDCVDGIYE